jgi:hypothetical protein
MPVDLSQLSKNNLIENLEDTVQKLHNVSKELESAQKSIFEKESIILTQTSEISRLLGLTQNSFFFELLSFFKFFGTHVYFDTLTFLEFKEIIKFL